ncbi:MAG: hypothetical protein NXI31_08700 [bacterium]|nr:hypothetical protein [bacterium]
MTNCTHHVTSPGALTLFSFLMLAACSGGGGDDPTPGGGTLTGSISGAWRIDSLVRTATGVCAGEIGDRDTEDYAITQTGTSIAVQTPAGPLTGQLTGQDLTISGSVPDGLGTTTITASRLRVDDSTLFGTLDWRWTDGVDSCTGTTELTGRRLSTAPAHGPGWVWIRDVAGEGGYRTIETIHGMIRVRVPPGGATLVRIAPKAAVNPR